MTTQKEVTVSNCYQITVERDYIAYADTEQEAVEKVRTFLSKRDPSSRVVRTQSALPIEQGEIVDVSPVNQRHAKSVDMK